MTPVPREDYRIGVPFFGRFREIFNSDALEFSGTGSYKNVNLTVINEGWNGKTHSTSITVPPLSGVIFELKAD